MWTALELAPETYVELAHAMDDTGGSTSSPQGRTDGTIALLLDAIEAAVRSRTRASVERIVLHGPPGPALLAHAAVRGSDVIVLGSHGHAERTTNVFGCVAREIVQNVVDGRTRSAVLLSGLLHGVWADGLATV